jgi:uncharacterized protein
MTSFGSVRAFRSPAEPARGSAGFGDDDANCSTQPRSMASVICVLSGLARGEATAQSDVDLLVDLKPGRTLLDLAAFRREAGEILDLSVDVATADMLEDRIRDEVLSEALPL